MAGVADITRGAMSQRSNSVSCSHARTSGPKSKRLASEHNNILQTYELRAFLGKLPEMQPTSLLKLNESFSAMMGGFQAPFVVSHHVSFPS
ncbi:hypothetical protein NQZ68_011334 [Dissostichus eleginoides]|nr:hypothetical protein NQZ68_011334 [Dissostichus eleginoides]